MAIKRGTFCFSFALRLVLSECILGSYLCCNHPLFQPTQIGVTPGARWPRRNIAEVLAESKLPQLVLEKLANIPRQVVVTVWERGKINGIIAYVSARIMTILTHPSIKGTSFSTFRTISIRSSSCIAKHVEIRCTSSVQKKRPHSRKPSTGFRRRMASTQRPPQRTVAVSGCGGGGLGGGDGGGFDNKNDEGRRNLRRQYVASAWIRPSRAGMSQPDGGSFSIVR